MRWPIWTAQETRERDGQTIDQGTAQAWLLEAAGSAVARVLWAERPHAALVIVGPGLNGADGWVAARRLARLGISVQLVSPHGARFPGHDQWQRAALGAGVRLIEMEDVGRAASDADWIVDAGFGTGLSRPLSSEFQVVLDQVKKAARPVLAVDVPSGVDSDSGELWGRPLRADITVTFAALKPAHLLFPAADLMGRVVVAEIGLVSEPGRYWATMDPAVALAALSRRRVDAHKYQSGRLAIVGGSRAYGGALGLAGLAALRAGAGYVEAFSGWDALSRIMWLPIVGRPQPQDGENWQLDEAGWQRLAAANAVVIGPGLGSPMSALVEQVRQAGKPTVVDADALMGWVDLGRPPWPEAIFTPHQAEAARMLGETPAWVSQHRRQALDRLREMTAATVILKGPHSLIGRFGEEQAWINVPGGSELATAGTGDVLAGLLGALLARGLDSAEAARIGAWWHGAAGEMAAQRLGVESVMAQDVAEELGRAENACREGWSPRQWPTAWV